jgi:hypothetical protein
VKRSCEKWAVRLLAERYASVQNQIKNMKFYAFIFLCLLIVSCSEKRTNRSLVSKPSPSNNELKTNKKEEDNHSSTVKDATNDVMLVNDILFNGKLKRYFTLKEFEITFGKPDSTKLLNEVQPCNIIFENSTGEIDQDDSYLYKNGSSFQKNGENLAVEEYRFLNGNYITYRGHRIDSETTKNDLKKIFPKAFRSISQDQHYEEKNLESIILREDKEGISDGHIRIFFKRGKIYSIWWWFPC